MLESSLVYIVARTFPESLIVILSGMILLCNNIKKIKYYINDFFVFYSINYNGWLQDSGYKLLSIFIVLIGSIQFGRNYSLGIATISTIIVLLIDFLSITNNKLLLSQYFEKDLVLFSALFVTAFILGMYVDIERAYSKELKTLTT